MNKWAETDAWMVRWALHDSSFMLPWDMLLTIPAAVVVSYTRPSFEVHESYGHWYYPCFRDVPGQVWIWREGCGDYALQVMSDRRPAQLWLPFGVDVSHEVNDSSIDHWLYRSWRFNTLRVILRQLPEPLT